MKSNGAGEQWRRLVEWDETAAQLLAGVDALLAGLPTSDRPAIRWSTLNHPALLLGSSQRPSEADFEACRAAGVTVHKRRSGGGAVFADEGLLWLDVALPAGHPLLLNDITASYRWFGEVWARALRTLGISAAVVSPPDARPLNAALDPRVQCACYGGVSSYEVLVGDSKIVGLSQVRRRPGGVLQSGLYRHWQPARIADLLSGATEERRERAHLLASRAAGLNDRLGPAVTFEHVIQGWEMAAGEMLRVDLVPDVWSDEERTAANEARERYAPVEAPLVAQSPSITDGGGTIHRKA